MKSPGRGSIVLAVAIVWAAAFALDGPVHRLFVGSTLAAWLSRKVVEDVVRLPGNFIGALVAGVLLAVFLPTPRRKIEAFVLLLAGSVVSATLAAAFKGTFGRARPDKWPGTPRWVLFRGGVYGFFHQTNVGFVSGDATQAFTLAEAVALAVPALRWPMYALAALTAAQRVIVGAHYPSDVVGGAIVGVVTVRCLARILRPAPATTDAPGVPDRASEGGAPSHAGP